MSDLEQRLLDRHKLRCKGKSCYMRKGFSVWLEQKDEILKKKCLMCGSELVDINPVEDIIDE